MMVLNLTYRDTIKEIVLLDVWDVTPDQIVLPNLALTEDVGKYVLFTDGSRMLSKLIHKGKKYLFTKANTLYRYDYISKCRPTGSNTQYSGLYSHHEHVSVRRPTQRERELAQEFIEGKTKRKLPKRCILLVLTKLRERMKAMAVDENYIVDKLKKEVDNSKNRGADRIEAIKILARIGGVEIGGLNTVNNKPPAIFAQFNTLTIQDKRRLGNEVIELPESKELTKAVNAVITDAEVIESVPL